MPRPVSIATENVVNKVLEDVVKARDPVWAVVKGEFRPPRRYFDSSRSPLAASASLGAFLCKSDEIDSNCAFCRRPHGRHVAPQTTDPASKSPRKQAFAVGL